MPSSTAFSGPGLSRVSFTDLNNNNADTLAALVFLQLTVAFVNALLADGPPFFPPGISLNVNNPVSTSSSCVSPSDFNFILTRIAPSSGATDVETCGTSSRKISRGCHVSMLC
ncbi:hypothetical protein F5878DRAFT_633653 [Lentinula raphanica]|uniref:Uncharacterized protein n=1 Tax=Lentinula raphanica TaxID=153919 RepID=A0AA38NYK7_9AGAR|nr:hypothetical protein F5878DRAFT_633653 [Lentinula raphanica]